MKAKLIYLTTLAVLLSGCATTARYETVLNTWMGENVNNLVNSWGYPQKSFNAPNGNMVYMYGNSSSYTMPTQTNTTYNIIGNSAYGNSMTTGGQTVNYWCRTYFEVNESNTIVNWRWEGNRCTAK